jgi:hypothetical protein
VEGRESSIGAVSEASFLLLGTNGSNMSDQLTRSGGRRAKRAIRISPRFWRPPLPLADRQTLSKLFGHLVGVGLDPPYSMPGVTL